MDAAQIKEVTMMTNRKVAYRAIYLFNGKPAGAFLGDAGAWYSTREKADRASREYNRNASRSIKRELLTADEYAAMVKD